LILVRKPTLNTIKYDSKWFAAVDFGTVNTNVIIRKDRESDPEPFKFHKDLIWSISGIEKQREQFLQGNLSHQKISPFPFQVYITTLIMMNKALSHF